MSKQIYTAGSGSRSQNTKTKTRNNSSNSPSSLYKSNMKNNLQLFKNDDH